MTQEPTGSYSAWQAFFSYSLSCHCMISVTTIVVHEVVPSAIKDPSPDCDHHTCSAMKGSPCSLSLLLAKFNCVRLVQWLKSSFLR